MRPTMEALPAHQVRRVLIVRSKRIAAEHLALPAYAQASIVSATVDRTSLNRQ